MPNTKDKKKTRKILQRLLESYKKGFIDFKEFAEHIHPKDFAYFDHHSLRHGIKDMLISTKANTLNTLKPLLKKSRIEKTLVFTVEDFKQKKDKIVQKIKQSFKGSPIVARSSALNEDTLRTSMAGYFHSELDIDSGKTDDIVRAIRKVIASYDGKADSNPKNQVLVQKQTKDILLSGVIFTRTLENNAPYYVINYDDTTGMTNTVTRGVENKTIKISRFAKPSSYPEYLKKLMAAIKEIEDIIPWVALDIEFAITRKQDVVLFQMRPLAVHADNYNVDDDEIRKRLMLYKNKFAELSSRKEHLSGKRTFFCDMPDWNPAEIIGNNPNYLDFSLYSYLITDSAWHEARTTQGYKDVNPAKLVVLFGNKPYIDVRNTFNSFTPAHLSEPLREKLVSFYLDKLESNPELQDKVEFQVLYTCYDLAFDKRSAELAEADFTKEEIAELKNALLELSNDFVANSKKLISDDLRNNEKMETLRKKVSESVKKEKKKDAATFLIKQAKLLLDDCRLNGTVQFSRLARLAFIGKIILKSLVSEGTITKDFYDSFMNTIATVASQLNDDFRHLGQAKIKNEDFIQKYGHLRPGTYDITSPRYDKNPGLLKEISFSSEDEIQDDKFSIPPSIQNRISQKLEQHGLNFDAKHLFDFIKSTLEARELSKFKFTKNLSYALELIAEAGALEGFTREDLAKLDCKSLFALSQKSSAKKTAKDRIIKSWGNIIAMRKREEELNRNILLGPVLFSEENFDVVSYYTAKPNFITQKQVKGKLVNLSKADKGCVPDITGGIVLLENGDPGYDWIFTKKILGLITRYGGVASHMSIRCAEFSIPAAIGCGDAIYEIIEKSPSLILDCKEGRIIPLNETGRETEQEPEQKPRGM